MWPRVWHRASTVSGALVTSLPLWPGLSRAASAARCLALGRKASRPGTSGLKDGGLCPHLLPTSRSLALWDLCTPASRMYEAWVCLLLGLWEGSQWFAKNSPKLWLCLPAGSRASSQPGPGGLQMGLLCFLELVLSTGMSLGAAGRIWEEALLFFLGVWLGPGEREGPGRTSL